MIHHGISGPSSRQAVNSSKLRLMPFARPKYRLNVNVGDTGNPENTWNQFQVLLDMCFMCLYLQMRFVQVLLAKKGAPFHETSPMLYDITSVSDLVRSGSQSVKREASASRGHVYGLWLHAVSNLCHKLPWGTRLATHARSWALIRILVVNSWVLAHWLYKPPAVNVEVS